MFSMHAIYADMSIRHNLPRRSRITAPVVDASGSNMLQICHLFNTHCATVCQIEALEEVERAYVHVDYLPRPLPEHKVEKDLLGLTVRHRLPPTGRDAASGPPTGRPARPPTVELASGNV